MHSKWTYGESIRNSKWQSYASCAHHTRNSCMHFKFNAVQFRWKWSKVAKVLTTQTFSLNKSCPHWMCSVICMSLSLCAFNKKHTKRHTVNSQWVPFLYCRAFWSANVLWCVGQNWQPDSGHGRKSVSIDIGNKSTVCCLMHSIHGVWCCGMHHGMHSKWCMKWIPSSRVSICAVDSRAQILEIAMFFRSPVIPFGLFIYSVCIVTFSWMSWSIILMLNYATHERGFCWNSYRNSYSDFITILYKWEMVEILVFHL